MSGMDTDKYKNKLLQEESRIELELTDLGVVNKINDADWTAKANVEEMNTADLNNLADADEEQNVNNAVVSELEARLQQVKEALQKIEDGTYGTCHKCGKQIEIARLDANPAATTCIACA